jgi:hypothetical protein
MPCSGDRLIWSKPSFHQLRWKPHRGHSPFHPFTMGHDDPACIRRPREILSKSRVGGSAAHPARSGLSLNNRHHLCDIATQAHSV